MELIWISFGRHLEVIWRREAEEANGGQISHFVTPFAAECKSSFKMLILLSVFEGQITKYCKLQAKMLRGSRQRSAAPLKAPLPTPPEPLQINLFGE